MNTINKYAGVEVGLKNIAEASPPSLPQQPESLQPTAKKKGRAIKSAAFFLLC